MSEEERRDDPSEDAVRQRMETLRPQDIVGELNRYIVGQVPAKRAVAIALRNRWRRQLVPEALRDEITPKNIIMIGPTGVGKTEIARRLAKLAQAPFIKVEATKFTEVGYVGRDVEAMIRDLCDLAVDMARAEEETRMHARARAQAEDKLFDLLGGDRERLRRELHAGSLDAREVDVEVTPELPGNLQVMMGRGLDDSAPPNLGNMLGNLFGGKKKRKMRVPEALEHLTHERASAMIDMDKIAREALRRVEQSGIVFIDEIDKIASKDGMRAGPDVSREGVQRDILPIVEGSTVSTKHGMVRTDHILFIAAGAFHLSKPSDLIPELQGRFPIRVELHSLGEEHFVQILTEPENSLIRQYVELLATEGVTLTFDEGAIHEIARVATAVNGRTENIGARRLHTVIERLLDEVSFNAPDLRGRSITITRDYVRERLDGVAKDDDLSRYIL